MTQAATQCREYLENRYPTIRIGRFACRDTASGAISQHSAYDGYDSNALDLFPPSGLSELQGTAFIQTVVDDLQANLTEWSGRKIIWQQPLHFNHAHIDFYPMITDHMWCGKSWTPSWKYSNGRTVTTRDPTPENGAYNGDDMSYTDFREAEFDHWTDQNIIDAYDRGRVLSTRFCERDCGSAIS